MNPYLILGLVAAWVLSLVGVGDWQYNAGVTGERLVWQTRTAEQSRIALSNYARFEKEAREAEAAHAKELATVSANYQEKLLNEKATNDRRVADIRNGSLKLRQQTGLSASASTGVRAPSSAATGCHGETGGEFSIETAEYLYRFAAEADEITEQLGACQQVVLADREANEDGKDD